MNENNIDNAPLINASHTSAPPAPPAPPPPPPRPQFQDQLIEAPVVQQPHMIIRNPQELIGVDRQDVERGHYSQQRSYLKKIICHEGLNLLVDSILFFMIFISMDHPDTSFYLTLKVWYLSWISIQASGQLILYIFASVALCKPRILLNR